MASSELSAQLSRLAREQGVSSVAVGKTGSGGTVVKHASLLFDRTKASALDTATVLALGRSGLEQLIRMDARFAPFEESLFSDAAARQNRLLLTQDAVSRLNASIDSFLLLLSPMFLLQHAHKAIEWLLRRYRIHEHNPDALVCCALPYHNTSYFLRILGLVRPGPSSPWLWLVNAKPTVPPEREVLIKQCVKRPATMRAVTDAVQRAVAAATASRSLLAFYTTLMIGVVRFRRRLTDDLVAEVVREVIPALRASQSIEYQCAGYLVLAALAARVALAEDTLVALTTTLTKHMQAKALDNALQCLLLLTQTQSMRRLPRSSLVHLLRHTAADHQSLGPCLTGLASQYDTTPLLRALVATLLDEVCSAEEPAEMLDAWRDLLARIVLPDALAQEIASDIVSRFLDADNRAARLQETLVVLNQRSGPAVDAAVAAALAAKAPASLDDGQRSRLLRLCADAFTGTVRHAVVRSGDAPDAEPTSLALAVLHPEASVRVLAVDTAARMYRDARNADAPVDPFIPELLLGRLSDDSARVVRAALEFPDLALLIPPHTLLPVLTKVLDRAEVSHRNRAGPRHVAALTCLLLALPERDPAVVPNLLPRALAYLAAIETLEPPLCRVLRSAVPPLAALHPLLTGVPAVLRKHVNVDDGSIADPAAAAADTAAALARAVTSATSAADANTCLRMLMPLFRRSDSLPMLASVLTNVLRGAGRYAAAVGAVVLPTLQAAVWALKPRALAKSPLPAVVAAAAESEGAMSPADVMRICLAHPVGVKHDDRLLEALAAPLHLLLARDDALSLLRSIVTHQPPLPGTAVARALHLAHALFQRPGAAAATPGDLLAYLVALAHPDKTVRHAALSLLQALPSPPDVLRQLLSARDEFLSDANHMRTALAALPAASVPAALALVLDDALDDMPPAAQTTLLAHAAPLLHESKMPVLQRVLSAASDAGVAAAAVEQFVDLPALGSVADAVIAPVWLAVRRYQSAAGALLQAVERANVQAFFQALSAAQQVQLTAVFVAIAQAWPGLEAPLQRVWKSAPLSSAGIQPLLQQAATMVPTLQLLVVRDAVITGEAALLADLFKHIDTAASDRDAIDGGGDDGDGDDGGDGDDDATVHEQADAVQQEFALQLVLDYLAQVIRRLPSRLPRGTGASINVAALLRVLQRSHAFHTHTSVLMVLTALSDRFPSKVMAHVIDVFRAVIASTLQKNPSYAHNVLTNTMRAVVPALVQHDKLAVLRLLKMFADCRDTLPEQRQVPLLTVLVETVGPLPIHMPILASLLLPADIPTAAVLLSALGADVALASMLALLRHAAAGCADAAGSDDESGADDDRDEHAVALPAPAPAPATPGLLPRVLATVQAVLRARDFLSSYLAADSADRLGLEQRVGELIATVLVLLRRTSSDRAVAAQLYDLLSALLHDLLSLQAFVDVIATLVVHPIPALRRRALVLFSDRVDQVVPQMTSEDVDVFADMARRIAASLLPSGSDDDDDDDDQPRHHVTRQTAMLAIEILARAVATRRPAPFLDVMPMLVRVVCAEHEPTHLGAGAALTIATLVAQLGERMLPYLPQFMPHLLSLLQTSLTRATSASNVSGDDNDGDGDDVDDDEDDEGRSSELLQVAVLSAVAALAQRLPAFISPYLSQLLRVLLHPRMLAARSRHGRVESQLATSFTTLGQHVAPRLLLPALFDVLGQARVWGAASMLQLLQLVHTVVSGLSPVDVAHYHERAFVFLRSALDTRSEQPLMSLLVDVEDAIASAFVALVLKLSEVQFRPMLGQLLVWATPGDSADMHAARLIPLWRVLASVAAALRSVFVPMFLPFFPLLIHLLGTEAGSDLLLMPDVPAARTSAEPSRKRSRKSQQPGRRGRSEGEVRALAAGWHDRLATLLIQTLHELLIHDDGSLLTGDRFDELLPVVTAQLGMIDLGPSVDAYRVRMADQLIPCLAQLAVAAADEKLWTPLNRAVMLHTRSESPSVRYAAVSVLVAWYERLGDDFLALLPETTPFLAELLEDDSPEVERLVSSCIKLIERHLGESLRSYLR